MSSSTELTKFGEQAARNMLVTLNEHQYLEDLNDERVKRGVTGLVLAAAGAEMELTPKSIDFAMEAYGRLGVSQEEFSVYFGQNIQEELLRLTPEEAEDEMRVLTTSIEYLEYGKLKSDTKLEPVVTEEDYLGRITRVQEIRSTIKDIEAFTAQEVDVEKLYELNVEYAAYVIEKAESAAAEALSEEQLRTNRLMLEEQLRKGVSPEALRHLVVDESEVAESDAKVQAELDITQATPDDLEAFLQDQQTPSKPAEQAF